MKTKIRSLFVAMTLLIGVRQIAAQQTAFTYQGQLQAGGSPANGSFDLTFAFCPAGSGTGQFGATFTNFATPVSNGLFKVTLDFGANFPGADRWLEIGVGTNGNGVFFTLSPRQQILSAPYAITAGNLSGTLAASQLTGTAPSTLLSGAYSGALSLNNAGNSFSGNAANLTGVNAASLGGVNATNFWQTGGNNVAAGQFLGSTNNQALELWVNGGRALRLEPGTSGEGAPNVVGGSPFNFVQSGVVAGTIGGGGATNYFGVAYTNDVTADFGTVGGGAKNTGSGQFATVGGGFQNTGSGGSATVSGGVLQQQQRGVCDGDRRIIQHQQRVRSNDWWRRG
jgi:hypothetical protein